MENSYQFHLIIPEKEILSNILKAFKSSDQSDQFVSFVLGEKWFHLDTQSMRQNKMNSF